MHVFHLYCTWMHAFNYLGFNSGEMKLGKNTLFTPQWWKYKSRRSHVSGCPETRARSFKIVMTWKGLKASRLWAKLRISTKNFHVIWVFTLKRNKLNSSLALLKSAVIRPPNRREYTFQLLFQKCYSGFILQAWEISFKDQALISCTLLHCLAWLHHGITLLLNLSQLHCFGNPVLLWSWFPHFCEPRLWWQAPSANICWCLESTRNAS